jgi:hypothetical protein
MAAGPPLTQLVLAASSVADDLGFVALADLRTALGDETGCWASIRKPRSSSSSGLSSSRSRPR